VSIKNTNNNKEKEQINTRQSFSSFQQILSVIHQVRGRKGEREREKGKRLKKKQRNNHEGKDFLMLHGDWAIEIDVVPS